MARVTHGRSVITDGFGIEQSKLPPFDDGRIDPRGWFEQPDARFEVEIGSGKGTFLIQQAQVQKDTNFLGIEWAGEYYRYAADRIRRHNLTHAKMLYGDACEFLKFWCADDVANVIHLYFSDPWPKKRHHKRRVVQEHTLREFHRVLRDKGELRIVTDHADLWQWYEDHVPLVDNIFERRDYVPTESAGDGELVGTNYERKFVREGRAFHGMTLHRR